MYAKGLSVGFCLLGCVRIAYAPWYNMHVTYSTIDDTAIVQIYSVQNPLHLIKKVYVCVFLLAILYRWTNSF